jgi:hypothetical protein
VKTQDLIAALAADAPPVADVRRGLIAALVIGGLASLIVFVAAIGARPDLAEALRTWRFDAKFAVALSALAASLAVVLPLLRPGALPGARRLWLAAPLSLMAACIVVEVLNVPADRWAARLVGVNAAHCLTLIPLLSIPPLAALLLAMRQGAPERPARAGALAGLAAAALAATLYASNCTDDSPLFVALWYSLAALIVMAAGALVGGRLLRW